MAELSDGRLYDNTGTLIPVPSPPPVAGPEPAGTDYVVNDRFREYFRGLTPGRIVAALEAADAGEPLDWVTLCEEMVEKDPKLASVLATRTKAVMGLDHEVRPSLLDDYSATQAEQDKADEIARFIDGALEKAGFNELVGDLMDAVGKPIAVDWIEWGNDENGLIVPLAFERIPPQHLRWGTTSDSIRVWSPIKAVMGPDGDIGVPLAPYTTVRALNNERRDHPTRAGLLRSVVWFYLFKNYALKDMVALADRFGTPREILSIPSEDFNNAALYRKARAELANIGARASGVISDKWTLESQSASSAKGGSDLMLQSVDYFDKAIAQLVLGHELSSQSSHGSGQLGITAALQVRQDLVEADCNFLSMVLRRDVFTPMVGWNFGWNLVHLTPYSVFHCEPPRDMFTEAATLSTLAKTFPLELSKQQLRDEYNLDEPVSPEDAISATPAAAPFGGGGGGGATPGAPGEAPIPQPPPVQPPQPKGPQEPRVNTSGQWVTGTMTAQHLTPRRKAISRQKKVDRVANRTVAGALPEIAGFRRQLRSLIRAAVKDGRSIPELTTEIARSYPDFDVAKLEKLLHENLMLVRMFGRNGA